MVKTIEIEIRRLSDIIDGGVVPWELDYNKYNRYIIHELAGRRTLKTKVFVSLTLHGYSAKTIDL